MAPDWVRNDPDLAAAWALDRSVTTAETADRRCRRLDGKLTKIGEEWSLSDCSANAGRGKATARASKAMSAVAAAGTPHDAARAGRLLHDDDDDGTDGTAVRRAGRSCVRGGRQI